MKPPAWPARWLDPTRSRSPCRTASTHRIVSLRSWAQTASWAGQAAAGGTLEAPGVVVQKNPRIRIDFGELNGEITPRVQAIAQTLPPAGVAAEPSTNIRSILWDKFTSFCGADGGLRHYPASPGPAARLP